LGFTHHWGLSRKGNWVVARKTAKSRMSRSLRAVGAWLRAHRHDPIEMQYAALCAKLRGHYGYYGIVGNSRAISSFRYWVIVRWHYWLDRRSTGRRLTWQKFLCILQRLELPQARLRHTTH
jgi:hypothetical protein